MNTREGIAIIGSVEKATMTAALYLLLKITAML